jgi:branched-subunit amino acid aminotransferase/4-amino-4-deoxychorismate lyase
VRGYGLVERPFSAAEAKSSRETFLSSTVVDLLPVVRIDDDPMGNGPSRKLGEWYLTHATARVIAK